eukprot:TRINITY_DN4843_c0_g1_i10.p1 TRINITY_DN4843_c0_g1~~TRINITY_DN4843_c0_g1_i10.p1  ORF type:complete len:243 (-),score=53.02 TRINITY_DN4843_c0_g1_i10:61-747(-)
MCIRDSINCLGEVELSAGNNLRELYDAQNPSQINGAPLERTGYFTYPLNTTTSNLFVKAAAKNASDPLPSIYLVTLDERFTNFSNPIQVTGLETINTDEKSGLYEIQFAQRELFFKPETIFDVFVTVNPDTLTAISRCGYLFVNPTGILDDRLNVDLHQTLTCNTSVCTTRFVYPLSANVPRVTGIVQARDPKTGLIYGWYKFSLPARNTHHSGSALWIILLLSLIHI